LTPFRSTIHWIWSKSAGAGVIRSLPTWGRVAGLLCCVCAAPALAAADAHIETVRFADPRWPVVKIVRGAGSGVAVAAAKPIFSANPANTEIVTFGNGRSDTVRVVRGSNAAVAPVLRAGQTVQIVGFAAPSLPAVNIVRGASLADIGVGLFGLASGGELDRVAFAVDGAESGHGSNLAMWRPELDGPQGPMQVSAAAALDVGGGDRFDMAQNRQLGRAFLAKLYQRYGNWPDAIAAYNWGPGNLDKWIAAGRPAERLPFETAHYLLRVLHDSLLPGLPRL
jgi:hypothetical protein